MEAAQHDASHSEPVFLEGWSISSLIMKFASIKYWGIRYRKRVNLRMGDGIKKSGSCFAKIAPQFLHLSKISPKLKGLCNPGPFKKSRPYFEPSCRNTGGAHLEVTPGFEPGNESFADSCLTTWLCHRLFTFYYMQLPPKCPLFFE